MPHHQPPTKGASLKNYRVHLFSLAGQEVHIAAMARPGYQHGSEQGCFDELRAKYSRAARPLIIGLNDAHEYSHMAKQNGFDYLHVEMADAFEIRRSYKKPYSPAVQMELNERANVPPAAYDHVYAAIQEAMRQGQEVILHCGAGHGRSGTTLAALKMRELIERTEGAILDRGDGVVRVDNNDYGCSALMYNAVNEVRTNVRGGPTQGGANKCVEFAEELNNLAQYEIHILREYCNNPNPKIALAATRALIRYRELPAEAFTELTRRRPDVAALIAAAVDASAAAVRSGNPPKPEPVKTQQQLVGIPALHQAAVQQQRQQEKDEVSTMGMGIGVNGT